MKSHKRRGAMKPIQPFARSVYMTKLKAILTLTAALAFALSPFTTTGFNGFSPDQFPVPQVDPPIQPAGWAFSIWGVIYLWLIASGLYGLLKRDDDPAWDRVRWPLIASLVVGAAWIPVANLSPLWATVLIWIMWGTAIWALLRTPFFDRWWLRVPVALYAGWLTAASCVATAVLLTGYGATPVLPIHAALLIVALALASTVLRILPAPEYLIPVAWALIGVIAANMDTGRPLMIALPTLGIILLAVPVILRHRFRPEPPV
ncbi:hypothetical protein [Pseudooceanicola nitratireducens]|uniref:hypothetical protein n=1 Tax=Pseudooceanicola nitratireducens TaxID=517719 RepID=UPI0030B91221